HVRQRRGGRIARVEDDGDAHRILCRRRQRDDTRDARFGEAEIAGAESGHRAAALIDDVDEDVARLRLSGFLPRGGRGGKGREYGGGDCDRRFHASLLTMRILYGPWTSGTSVSCRTDASSSSTRRASRPALSTTRISRRCRWRGAPGRPTTTRRCGSAWRTASRPICLPRACWRPG